MSPARFPHAQRLGLWKFTFEAEEDPTVAEKHLQAVLSQAGKVLVEARVHEPQQLSQVHLEKTRWAEPPGHKGRVPRPGPPGSTELPTALSSRYELRLCGVCSSAASAPGPAVTARAHRPRLLFHEAGLGVKGKIPWQLHCERKKGRDPG